MYNLRLYESLAKIVSQKQPYHFKDKTSSIIYATVAQEHSQSLGSYSSYHLHMQPSLHLVLDNVPIVYFESIGEESKILNMHWSNETSLERSTSE